MEVLPQPLNATAVPPQPSVFKKSRRLKPFSIITNTSLKSCLSWSTCRLLVAREAIVRAMRRLVGSRVYRMILLVTLRTPTHGDRLLAARNRHRLDIAVAIAAG